MIFLCKNEESLFNLTLGCVFADSKDLIKVFSWKQCDMMAVKWIFFDSFEFIYHILLLLV